jgi:hypothetical protein
MLHILLHQHAVYNRKTNGQSLGTFQKQCSFGNRAALDKELLSVFKISLKASRDPVTVTLLLPSVRSDGKHYLALHKFGSKK